MAARVCKSCWLKYALGTTRCGVCGSRLLLSLIDSPQEDVEERVQKELERRLADIEPGASDVRELVWRYKRLKEMGLEHERATELARLRDAEHGGYAIDLHRFHDLVTAGATADQAVRILQ